MCLYSFKDKNVAVRVTYLSGTTILVTVVRGLGSPTLALKVLPDSDSLGHTKQNRKIKRDLNEIQIEV